MLKQFFNGSIYINLFIMLVRLNAAEHSLYSAENEDVCNVLFRFLEMPIKG